MIKYITEYINIKKYRLKYKNGEIMDKKSRIYSVPTIKYNVGFDFIIRIVWMLCICVLCVYGIAFQNSISKNIKLCIWTMMLALVMPLVVKKELKLILPASTFFLICTLNFYGELILHIVVQLINHFKDLGVLDIVKGVVVIGISALFLFGIMELIVNRKRVFQSIVAVKKKKTGEYGITYISGASIGVIYYLISKLVFHNEIGLSSTILTTTTVSVIILFIVSGDVLELRKYPITLVLGGWWAIVVAIFVSIQANILSIEDVWQKSPLVTILYVIVIFELWLAFSLILCKRIETRLLVFFIIIGYLLASAIAILYISIEHPQNFFRSVACIGLFFLFLSVITIPILYIIRGEMKIAEHLKKMGSVIVAIVIFAWMFLFGVICIIRWNGIINGRQEFFELMLECGAYVLVAFFTIAFLGGIVILVYRTVALVIAKKNDSRAGNNGKESLGLYLIFPVFLLILLITCTWVCVQNSFLADAVAEIGDIPETAQVPTSIIIYVCVMLLISAITVIVFKNSFSINTFNQCSKYMNNESETLNVYAMYKLYKTEGNIKIRQEFLDEIRKYDNDEKNSILFPIKMSDVTAIKIAVFSFSVRDFCFDLVGEILSPFKTDGLITGMIKDFVSLFTGK